MKYDDITPSMRMFIGNREGFRRIGFSADDLYCECAPSLELAGALGVYCTLKTRGKEFRVWCGPAESTEAVAAEYARVAKAAENKTLDTGSYERIWQESEVRARTVDLLRALMAKGIAVPQPDAN